MVVLAGAFGRYHTRAGRAFLLFLWATVFFLLIHWAPYGLSGPCARALLVLMAAVACLLIALRWLRQRPIGLAWRAAATSVLIAFALTGLDRLRGDIRADLLHLEFTNHDLTRYWVDPALIVDGPDQPRRIAVTSGPWQDIDNWLVLPFMGRALQNEALYIPVSEDGEVRHFGEPPVNAEYDRSANYESWRSRLLGRNIAVVMSFPPASIELGWMEMHPRDFRRLAGESRKWGLFSVINEALDRS
jgi:hypothetical protein